MDRIIPHSPIKTKVNITAYNSEIEDHTESLVKFDQICRKMSNIGHLAHKNRIRMRLNYQDPQLKCTDAK